MPPVLLETHAKIPIQTIQALGFTYSYVTSSNNTTKFTILHTGKTTGTVEIPSVYKMPLHVLSYRFELVKYTIARLRKTTNTLKSVCNQLLCSLLYLDNVRTTFFVEATSVAGRGDLQEWRCHTFDYWLWLDYACGEHDDQARRRLEDEFHVTFEAITLRMPETDILQKRECLLTDYHKHQFIRENWTQ